MYIVMIVMEQVLIKMANGEEKVIGMMADKVQVMITLPFANSLSAHLKSVIEKYQEKAFIYLISSQTLENNTNIENLSHTLIYHNT